MGDHQYGLPVLMGCMGQKLHDFPAAFGVQVAGRLVSQNQHGIMDKRPADGGALLLAAGQLAWEVGAAVGETKDFQELVYFFRVGLLVVQEQGEDDVLFYGQLWDKLEGLEDEADVAAAEDSTFLFGHGEELLAV